MRFVKHKCISFTGYSGFRHMISAESEIQVQKNRYSKLTFEKLPVEIIIEIGFSKEKKERLDVTYALKGKEHSQAQYMTAGASSDFLFNLFNGTRMINNNNAILLQN